MLLLLCLSFHCLYLHPYLLLDFLNDLIIIQLLSFLKLWLSYTQRMVILIDPIFPLSLPHLDLLYNSYQIIT